MWVLLNEYRNDHAISSLHKTCLFSKFTTPHSSYSLGTDSLHLPPIFPLFRQNIQLGAKKKILFKIEHVPSFIFVRYFKVSPQRFYLLFIVSHSLGSPLLSMWIFIENKLFSVPKALQRNISPIRISLELSFNCAFKLVHYLSLEIPEHHYTLLANQLVFPCICFSSSSP